MSRTPDRYPGEISRRLECEWTAYENYYSNRTLEKPFFYHNHSREKRFIDSLVGRFAITPGSRMLDIGCGNGLYSHLFHEHRLRVTAVDRSERAIAYCTAQYGDTCRWICDDAFALKQLSEYDYAFCLWFMYFNAFDNPTDAAGAGRRLMEYLKPTGTLFFLWHSDLTAVRLPPERFSVINFTMEQLKQIFAGYSAETYAIDSNARICSILGKHSFNKYVTRLTCARVVLASSSWTRVRILVVVHNSSH